MRLCRMRRSRPSKPSRRTSRCRLTAASMCSCSTIRRCLRPLRCGRGMLCAVSFSDGFKANDVAAIVLTGAGRGQPFTRDRRLLDDAIDRLLSDADPTDNRSSHLWQHRGHGPMDGGHQRKAQGSCAPVIQPDLLLSADGRQSHVPCRLHGSALRVRDAIRRKHLHDRSRRA